ncbi:MAG: hypothetical protein QXS37_05090 [Candidatus Aenigmatarchaeota archaeon]
MFISNKKEELKKQAYIVAQEYMEYLKKNGKLQRILEYAGPIIEEADIFQDLFIVAYEELKCLNPTKLKSKNGNRDENLIKSVVKSKLLSVFTQYIHKGEDKIERIIEDYNGRTFKVTDKEFYKVRKNIKRLNSLSKRNTISIEELVPGDKDGKKRDSIEVCSFKGFLEIENE